MIFFVSFILEPKPTTNIISSPPTHKNPQLQQKIETNKNAQSLDLSSMHLTDDDMQIVVYYFLQNNKVSQHLIYFHL